MTIMYGQVYGKKRYGVQRAPIGAYGCWGDRKICRRCLRELEMERFPKSRKTMDGRSDYCDDCTEELTR